MNDARVAVALGEAVAAYGFGAGHPFGPDRLDAFWSQALRLGLDRQVEVVDPVAADDAALALFHTPSHIDRVRLQCRFGQGTLDAGDTPARAGLDQAARAVVGSALAAVSRVYTTDTRRVFLPIGGLHHARRERAAGFCVFNDIGVVIEALRARGVKRIAYVDIDAHHGDGVYYPFESAEDVIAVDIHEDGRFLYPGTGDIDECGLGQAQGLKRHVPLAPGTGDEVMLRAWAEAEEFLEAARPEIVLLQAGVDSLRDDPLAHLALTPRAHATVTASLAQMATRHSEGRMLVFGGGGYNRANLAAGWCAVLEALLA